MSYSLYFHVPFCVQKCGYCHFYVLPFREDSQKIYLQALKKEWDLRHHFLSQKERLISIYFGGGTPSLLGPKAIEMILSWINPDKEVEVTLEINPETSCFHFPGINRISLGVQSFDSILLKKLTRTHTAKKAEETIDQFASSGLQNISIDLMYDLPEQTLESWEATLKKASSLPISHISLYNLTIEPHTSFYQHRTTLLPQIPPPKISAKMLKMAINQLKTFGFKQYEISAFSKSHCESRHNTGYWEGRPFLGFGPSAFSYWKGARFQNCANLNRYIKLLDQNQLPTDFYEKLPPIEATKEILALKLRLLKGVNSWPYRFKSIYKKLCDQGFLNPYTLNLSDRGILFHDSVGEIIMND
ncbi:MAG: radical SAM family heme chaperone HemW [Chlamydiales bacterium]